MSIVKTALEALAIARSSEADEGVLAVYLHSLEDLDFELVVEACERLGKLPRQAYQAALPEVGAIRAEVARLSREYREADFTAKLLPHTTRREDDPSTWVFCLDCKDSSYRQFRCDGLTGERGTRDEDLKLLRCARRMSHQAHTYAERCQCYSTNPVIAKRRERRSEAAA